MTRNMARLFILQSTPTATATSTSSSTRSLAVRKRCKVLTVAASTTEQSWPHMSSTRYTTRFMVLPPSSRSNLVDWYAHIAPPSAVTRTLQFKKRWDRVGFSCDRLFPCARPTFCRDVFLIEERRAMTVSEYVYHMRMRTTRHVVCLSPSV